MIKSNCHTHTVYCDGSNTAREMVLYAIERNFKSLGFSCHSPMNYENDWGIKKEDISSYLCEIRSLQAEFKDVIDILCGMEVDSDFSDVNPDDFEYTIGSVHQFQSEGKIYPLDLDTATLKLAADELFDGDFTKMACAYFNKLADFICENNFDIVGHFDIITKFNEHERQFDEDNTEYQNAAIKAIDRILAYNPDILFEINTGAMFRCNNKRPYPAPFIMQHLYKKGAKITITSDAHKTEALDFAFDVAAEYAKSFGYNTSFILTSEGIKEIDL